MSEPGDMLEQIEDALLDHGFDLQDAEVAARVCSQFLTSETNRRAGVAVRKILETIAKTRPGKSAEFRAIMAIVTKLPMDSLAREAGLSRQRVWYHVRKFRKLF